MRRHVAEIVVLAGWAAGTLGVVLGLVSLSLGGAGVELPAVLYVVGFGGIIAGSSMLDREGGTRP